MLENKGLNPSCGVYRHSSPPVVASSPTTEAAVDDWSTAKTLPGTASSDAVGPSPMSDDQTWLSWSTLAAVIVVSSGFQLVLPASNPGCTQHPDNPTASPSAPSAAPI